MAQPRILVLDGQTNQALACVRSLGRASFDVAVAGPRLALAGWSRYCRERVHLSTETVTGFAQLRAWAMARGITCVLPLTERSCILCNAERRAWESAGIIVGCAPDALLREAFDKARTLEIAEASGVAFPPTRQPTSLAEAHAAATALGFPCVVKSRFSNAWDGVQFSSDPGTSYVRHPDELDAALEAHRQGEHWPLIQGFVPGRGKGVFALFDHGRAVAWFAHERLRDVRPSGSGSSLRRSAPLEARLQAPAERLLGALQWHGPAMVEFRDDGVHKPCLMEVNGRFWGSLQLAVSAGADFPRWWVEILLGRAPAAAPGYQTGVTLRWVWGDVKRFLYILAGPPPGYPGSYPTIWQGLRELLGPQPAGTHSETYEPADRRPALGEWVQGIDQLLAGRRRSVPQVPGVMSPRVPGPPPPRAQSPLPPTPAAPVHRK